MSRATSLAGKAARMAAGKTGDGVPLREPCAVRMPALRGIRGTYKVIIGMERNRERFLRRDTGSGAVCSSTRLRFTCAGATEAMVA